MLGLVGFSIGVRDAMRTRSYLKSIETLRSTSMGASTIKLGTNGMMLAARYTSRGTVVCFEGLSTTAGISCIGVDKFKTAFHHSLNEVNNNSV